MGTGSGFPEKSTGEKGFPRNPTEKACFVPTEISGDIREFSGEW